MVNGSRYYRALESVSIASAMSTALTIYPCQIRVHQRWQSKLQLPTARKKEWRPAIAGSSPHAVTCQHCDTHYFSRPRTHNFVGSWSRFCSIDTAAHSDYFVLMRLLNTLTHSLTHSQSSDRWSDALPVVSPTHSMLVTCQLPIFGSSAFLISAPYLSFILKITKMCRCHSMGVVGSDRKMKIVTNSKMAFVSFCKTA